MKDKGSPLHSSPLHSSPLHSSPLHRARGLCDEIEQRLATLGPPPPAATSYYPMRSALSWSLDRSVLEQDATWQAYNCWGTTNTYGVACDDPGVHAGSPAPPNRTRRAYKASFNRPFATRAYRNVNMPLNSEYPMIRWLERNGYDVSYWSCVDADRFATRLATTAAHRLYLSVGHDEYWSGEQRRAVTAARDRGMHLAFLSGNEVYWRTRWEAAADGSAHRTLVIYKETQHISKLDPMEGEWTGTWRDGRSINPLGSQPENRLTGQIYAVNAWRNDPLIVPSRYVALSRSWTSIPPLPFSLDVSNPFSGTAHTASGDTRRCATSRRERARDWCRASSATSGIWILITATGRRG